MTIFTDTIISNYFAKKIVSHYHRLPFGMLVIGENVIRNRDKKQLLK